MSPPGSLGCGVVTSRGERRPCPGAQAALLPVLRLPSRLSDLTSAASNTFFPFLGVFFFVCVNFFSQISAITGPGYSWKGPARTRWGSGPCLDGFGMLTGLSPGQASVT